MPHLVSDQDVNVLTDHGIEQLAAHFVSCAPYVFECGSHIGRVEHAGTRPLPLLHDRAHLHVTELADSRFAVQARDCAHDSQDYTPFSSLIAFRYRLRCSLNISFFVAMVIYGHGNTEYDLSAYLLVTINMIWNVACKQPVKYGILQSTMDIAFFIQDYIVWHYGQALGEIMALWKTMLWFGYHYFSLGLLSRTLFKPLRRVHTQYDFRSLNIQEILSSALINGLMRLMGMFLRIATIAAGAVAELFIIIALPIFLFVWVFLPFVAGGLFLWGIMLLL